MPAARTENREYDRSINRLTWENVMEYAETAVLVAVMENDIAEATRRLRDFLPGELSEFERQAEMLLDCIRTTPR